MSLFGSSLRALLQNLFCRWMSETSVLEQHCCCRAAGRGKAMALVCIRTVWPITQRDGVARHPLKRSHLGKGLTKETWVWV